MMKVSSKWSVLLVAVAAAVFGGVVLIGSGFAQTSELQDSANSQPSKSRFAAEGSGDFQASATNARVLWAVVASDGRLARDKGARDANRLRTGNYEVIFERNVRRCAYVASIGLPGAEGMASPGQISTVGRVGARNGVFVATQNSSGGRASRGFHLVVNCP
jgi:hypothetical protein